MTQDGKVLVTGETVVRSNTYQSGDDDAKGDPTIGREPRPPQLLPVKHSRVEVSLGLTKSIGNYEFARVDVSIAEFCDATPQARMACFDEIKQEARDMVGKILPSIVAAAQRRT